MLLGKLSNDKVHGFDITKDIWDTHATTHEETNKENGARANIITHQYGTFKMKSRETIDQMMFGRFHIPPIVLNHLGRPSLMLTK